MCPCKKASRRYLRIMWSLILYSCDQLFRIKPWFYPRTAPPRAHLFCPPVLSVPIIQIIQHCLQIPVSLFCGKMVLKLRVWVSSQSIPSIETLERSLLCHHSAFCSSSFYIEALIIMWALLSSQFLTIQILEQLHARQHHVGSFNGLCMLFI